MLKLVQVPNKKKAEGETELTSAISRLLVLTENYPQLKADSQATALIAELEGTENRMFAARDDYNKVATEYNKIHPPISEKY